MRREFCKRGSQRIFPSHQSGALFSDLTTSSFRSPLKAAPAGLSRSPSTAPNPDGTTSPARPLLPRPRQCGFFGGRPRYRYPTSSISLPPPRTPSAVLTFSCHSSWDISSMMSGSATALEARAPRRTTPTGCVRSRASSLPWRSWASFRFTPAEAPGFPKRVAKLWARGPSGNWTTRRCSTGGLYTRITRGSSRRPDICQVGTI